MIEVSPLATWLHGPFSELESNNVTVAPLTGLPFWSKTVPLGSYIAMEFRSLYR